MESYLLKFHGFNPSEFTYAYIESKMRDLHYEAPSGSILNATYVKNGGVYSGHVKILSKAGRFVATASDFDVKTVNKLLLEQIRSQLNLWKFERFQNGRDEEETQIYRSVS